MNYKESGAKFIALLGECTKTEKPLSENVELMSEAKRCFSLLKRFCNERLKVDTTQQESMLLRIKELKNIFITFESEERPAQVVLTLPDGKKLLLLEFIIINLKEMITICSFFDDVLRSENSGARTAFFSELAKKPRPEGVETCEKLISNIYEYVKLAHKRELAGRSGRKWAEFLEGGFSKWLFSAEKISAQKYFTKKEDADVFLKKLSAVGLKLEIEETTEGRYSIYMTWEELGQHWPELSESMWEQSSAIYSTKPN